MMLQEPSGTSPTARAGERRFWHHRPMLGHGISPPSEGRFPSLGGANEWLNSPPLTADGLRGKVVVVNFCTYTCINWLRSLPYVRAWDEAYRDHGLVTIGVHTPEFSFEHDLENIRQALRETRVGISDRGRQRLRGLGGVREPLLAGALLHRCRGTDPASPVRRGRLRAVGERHPAAPGRSRAGRRRPAGVRLRGCARTRGAGRLEQLALPGDVPRIPADDGLRVAGRTHA